MGLFLLRSILKLLTITLLLFGLSCQGDGDSETSSAFGSSTISGVVKSSSGSQAEMASWVIVFVERSTGLSQYAVLGALGNYSIENVRLGSPQTIVLLDPQFRLAAVLTSPSTVAESIHQYFTSSSVIIPSLVHQGPVVKFSDTETIIWDADAATDTDGDGIDNTTDYDLDGDGLINWFDSNNDGDDLADVFDTDANADEVSDLAQPLGDLYFTENLALIAVQVIQEVQADSSLSTQLTFTTKINNLANPKSISVQGPEILFSSSQARTADADGNLTLSAWDGTIVDDGFNEDGNAEDRLYARSVALDTGKSPRTDQVVFFQFTDQSDVVWNYPYSFPPVTSGVFAGAYDTSTRVVTKSGVPISPSTNYNWSVHIYDALGMKIYGSELISGSVDTFTIPEDTLDAAQSYTAKVVASTIDPISSYPTWTCLLYTSPSPRDLSTSRMPSSA